MTTTETMRQDRRSRFKRRAMPRLRLLSTPGCLFGPARDFELSVGVTTIGREIPEKDGIEINDRRISRHHASVEVDSAYQVRIRDLDSKNGLYVNGARLQAGTLKEGDLVRLGDTIFLVRSEPLSLADAEIPFLLGPSPGLAALRSTLRRLGAEAMSVLICGETGTGKELLARGIHQQSGRTGAYIAVNCAAIPESLAESQLFGQVDGVATNVRAQPGLVRSAHGGTLFLDEIGDMPLFLQPKLLRVLEDRTVMPLGTSQSVHVNLRVISATHRPLESLLEEGRFREDLYARLAGVVLNVPPLRQRQEDILPLLQKSLTGAVGGSRDEGCSDMGTKTEGPQITPDFIELLLLHPWPRNVRQVFEVANHLRIFGLDEALLARMEQARRPTSDMLNEPRSAESLGAPAPGPAAAASHASPASGPPVARPQGPGPSVPAVRMWTRPGDAPTPDRDELILLLQKHRGIIQDVAVTLGCSRRHVGRLMKQYGIARDELRSR